MNQFERARGWCDSHHDVFLDAVRIYLGIALFVKGAVFIGNMSQLVETVSGNVPWTYAWIAHYVAAAHLVGGAMLALGIATRLAAVVQIPPVLGAVLFVHRKEGLFTPAGTMELALLVLFALVVFSFAGAGRVSVDSYVGGESYVRRLRTV
jgi:uncharacterized membrane protein YphA (DoxX/SURF4 family)